MLKKSAWILVLLIAFVLLVTGCNHDEEPVVDCTSGHSYAQAVTVKDATCTENGENQTVCTVCGDVQTTTIYATGHTAGDWVTDVAPTCTTQGSRYKACLSCEERLNRESVSATGHTKSDWIIDSEARCESDGAKHVACTTCGTELERAVIAATRHAETKLVSVKAVSCTEDGANNRVCVACEKIIRANIRVPATNHARASWQTVREADCTTDGAEKRYCPDCEDFTGEVRVLDAKGHRDGRCEIVQQGDCLTDHIAQIYCADCDAVIRTDITESTGHTKTDWITELEPTCTATGTAYRSCLVCGTKYVETKPLSATGHAPGAWETDQDVSCEEDGHRRRVCQNEGCGMIVEEEAIRHEGHKGGEWIVDVKAACTTDGHRYKLCLVCETSCTEEIIPATGHTKGEWRIELKETCTTDGEKRADCTVCLAEGVYSEIVPATGHKDGAWVISVKVTCTTDGLKQRFCTVCDAKTAEEIIYHRGHQQENASITKPATCLEAGIQNYYCKVCETLLESEPLPALGHSLVWKVDRAATCEEDGVRHADCNRAECGAKNVESEAIPATGHTASNWIVSVKPGCESEGEEHIICTVQGCNAILQIRKTDPVGHTEGEWRPCVADPYQMQQLCGTCGAVLRVANKENVVITSGRVESVDLANYRIVYADSVTDSFRMRVAALAEYISLLTGSTVRAVSDTSAATAKEIVIGRTSRAATATALAEIEGEGYAILRAGNTIVITGTTNLEALLGMEHFIEKYLENATSATIRLPELSVSDGHAVVTVGTANGKTSYTAVYDKNLDTDDRYEQNPNYVSDTGTIREEVYGEVDPPGTGRDYAYDAALAVKEQLLGLGITLTVGTDAAAPKGAEILVGRPNRAVLVSALGELAPHEYGIMVRDGHVIVTGYSVESLRVAAPRFVDYLTEARNAAGNIVFPMHFTEIGEVNDNWLVDFPLPQGVPLYNTEDAGDSSLQYLYMGSGVSLSAYEAYCRTLQAKGYTVLTQSDMEGSYFKTFVNAAKTEMLHVCYNAFSNAGTYELDTKADAAASDLPASWFKYEEKEYAFTSPQIRIVSAYINESILSFPAFSTTAYSERASASDTMTYIYYNPNYPTSYSASQTYSYFFNTTYQKRLKDAGYRILFSSTAGSVPFYTARNEKTGVEITVELHENGQLKVGGVQQTWSYLTAHVKRPGTVTLPTAAMLDPKQSYKKVTDTAITQIALAGADVGTGYVMTLEDGRFVVIDGGASVEDAPERIWHVLSTLHKKIWGRDPSPTQPIEIAAWVITHSHGDHLNGMWMFSRYYGGNGGSSYEKIPGGVVRVQYVIANTPEFSTVYNAGSASTSMRRALAKIHGYFKHGFTFIKVQTGQKLYFANLEIHTLITHSDLNPQRIMTFNDTSAVMRFTFKPTGGDPVTFLSTGDAYIYEGRWLCAMYGKALHSDMVTMAHHGGPAVDKAFYKLVSPDTVWWPHTSASAYYKNESAPGYLTTNNWNSKVDQYVVLALESVDYVYLASTYHITLDITASGPDYEGVHDVGASTAIGSSYRYELSRNVSEALLVTKRPGVSKTHEQYGKKHEIHDKKPIIIKKK